MTYLHQPVLLDEVIENLAIRPDGVYVDLTFGRGGHSREILKRLGPNGRLIAMDKDPVAVAEGKTGVFCDPRFSIQHGSFVALKAVLEPLGLLGRVDGILLDLGVSSPQLDDPSRGFSFTREGPLDMRMDTSQSMDAATWLHQTEKSDIIAALRDYGEERFARRIANAIVEERGGEPMTTTKQLVELIERVVPTRERGKHPATRCFQAIRIAVNDELEELKQCLQHGLSVLSVGGRIAVISFHSLEDRIVKRFFQKEAKGDDYPSNLPIQDAQIKRYVKIIGALIRPTDEEVKQNRRARSARLRVAEKIATKGGV
jgi:16S rRNA (cytosine1402-N4)-methyltransferase